MPRLDALDDFVLHTLAVVPGRWQKLVYIAGLRRPDGRGYRHWGMSRVYGAEATDRALAKVHTRVFMDILCAPISELALELWAGAPTGADQAALLGRLGGLRARETVLLPPDPDGGARSHFSSVLDALWRLARSRSVPTGPGA